MRIRRGETAVGFFRVVLPWGVRPHLGSRTRGDIGDLGATAAQFGLAKNFSTRLLHDFFYLPLVG